MSALVTLDAATKNFKNVTAFDDVSLTINQGETIALVGPNGSGKTTLLRCIVGMIAFDNAVLQKVFGQIPPINIEYRKQVLYIPDDDNLIDSLTAREYYGLVAVTYGTSQKSIQPAIQSLKNLDFDISKLDTTIGTYSHGMRKKVQLASMFIPDAAFIIVDEPTNGLDPTSIILLKQQFEKLQSKKRTLLLSTHNLAFAEQLAQRVLLMKNGLVYDGTLKALLRSSRSKTLEEAYAYSVMKNPEKR